METALGYAIGQILGALIVYGYLNYVDNRSKRKKKNYNKFRK